MLKNHKNLKWTRSIGWTDYSEIEKGINSEKAIRSVNM